MVAESCKKILISGGTVAVAVGTYLPWLRMHPNLSPNTEIPTIYFTGMSTGFEGFDFALLGAVGLVLLLRGISSWAQTCTAVTLIVRVGTAVFPVYYQSYSTLLGFSATFVPTLGWYLTVLGGVLLTVAGGLQLSSIIQRLETTEALID